jgi:selenocysteine lyase/cysteine desulfurase
VIAAATLAGTVARVDEALAERPAALLAVPGADPVTGELLPIAELADVAHAHGAALAVDAALVAPAGRLDLCSARVDHAVVSAAELSAQLTAEGSSELPARLSAGALVGRTLAAGTGRAHVPGARAHAPVAWAEAAALAVACSELAGLPDGELAAHVGHLRAQLLAGLHALPGVRVLQLWPDATAYAGVLSLTVHGWSPEALLTRLTGPAAALPRLDAAGDGVRVRLHARTTDDEVEALLEALEDVVTGSGPDLGATA